MSKYISLYETIRDEIINGVYKCGDKLPSKRVTADKYDVSPITVEHALDLLSEEGYIEPKERSGYFVSYVSGNYFNVSKPSAFKPAFANHTSQIEFPFGIYAKTCRKVITDYEKEILEVSPSFGNEKLRRVIADYLRRNRHISTDYRNIIIGSGAEYLYGLIVRALGRDKIFGVEDPSYQKITDIYLAENVITKPLKLSSDGIDSKVLWETEANVLHISPYRSFPSLVTASAAKKREYIKWCQESDRRIIIEDDFESEFSPLRKAEETVFALSEGNSVIYVNTFTKTIGSAARIAYMVIPKSLISLFEKRVGFYSCPVPTYNQLIVAELIENGDFERHINKVRRILRDRVKING